jgi:PAS domain S-box-containing protein
MTPHWRLPGLRFRLIAVMLLVQMLTIGLIAGVSWRLVDRYLRDETRLVAEQIRPLLAAALTPPVARLDADAIDEIATQALISDGLHSIEVTAANGRMLARTVQAGAEGQAPTVTDEIALRLAGTLVGTVRYGFSTRRIDALHDGFVRQILIASAVAIALSSALIAWLTIALTGRLARLRDAGRQFARGDLKARIEDAGQDEVGDLARVFNRMATKLAEQFQRLKEKDERLSLVIQGSSDGIWDWDLLANEVYFSPRFRELLGYTDEAEFRRGFFMTTSLHPDDRERVLGAQYDHLENKTPFDETYRLRRRDGSYRWFRGRGQARWDGEGKAYRYAGSITDIHAQKMSEAARRESEERLYYAIRGSSDGIWDWTLRADRYYLSPRFKQLLGYRDDELPNRRDSFLGLIHPDDRARVEAQVAHHFKTHETYDVTFRMRHRDGHFRWFRSRGEAVWDENGQVVRFAGSSGDITEQRQAQDSIRALLTEKQAILDNVPVGIVFSESGRIVTTNQRFDELFACAGEAMRGRPLADILDDSTGRIEPDEPFTRELELPRCDGSRNWFYVTARQINPDRPADGALWIFADIASLKAAGAALQEVRNLSDAIIRSLPGVFFVLEADGRIVRWNLNLAHVTGLNPAHHDHLLVRNLCHPDDRQAFQDALANALRDGQSMVEARLQRADGHHLPHVFTFLQVELRGASHLVGIGIDISDRLHAENEIRALNDALETRVRERTAELTVANQELESFSYSVSHDLSSPLRGIDGFSRILEEDFSAQLDTTALGYLRRIRAATGRMQALIDEMLKLARISRDEMRREDVNLSALASEIGDYLGSEHPERQLAFTVAPDIHVHADRNLLRIVLDNLLRNAWKFTGQKAEAAVEVGCLRDGAQPVYFVKDNGAGFDMRFANKLFGAFQRLHRDSEFAGTGIGLATVSRIIHRHGGRVWAEADVGQGATFFFTLG